MCSTCKYNVKLICTVNCVIKVWKFNCVGSNDKYLVLKDSFNTLFLPIYWCTGAISHKFLELKEIFFCVDSKTL